MKPVAMLVLFSFYLQLGVIVGCYQMFQRSIVDC
jgi:hypothetical protein